MDKEKIRKILYGIKEVLVFSLKNPGLISLVVCFIPFLVADKLHKKLFGEKLIKPEAREPRKNKGIEIEKRID
jgi:hypothetical protein